jgi:predicted MFS family arabinose efflux permease
MYALKNMFQVFVLVTAGNTIGAAIFLTLLGREYTLNYLFLWQMIGIAAVCALGNMIFWSKRELSKRQIKLRYGIHYSYNNIVVVGSAFLFGWIEVEDPSDIIAMFVLVAIVYLTITTIIVKSDRQTADELNKKLRKYNASNDINSIINQNIE